MLKNFLFDSNRVFVDYKRNRIYMTPQLLEVWLDIKDDKGIAIPLESFVTQARFAAEKQWDDNEWIRFLSGVFQCANDIPHSEITTLASSVSFLFGILFERIRHKRGISIQVHTRQLSSEEMDSTIKDFEETVRRGVEEED